MKYRCSPSRARTWKSTGTTPGACCSGPTAAPPNLILDDGGDLTLLVHLGVKAEKDASFLDKDPGHEEGRVLYALVKRAIKEHRLLRAGRQSIKGVSRGDDDRRAPPLPDGSKGEKL